MARCIFCNKPLKFGSIKYDLGGKRMMCQNCYHETDLSLEAVIRIFNSGGDPFNYKNPRVQKEKSQISTVNALIRKYGPCELYLFDDAGKRMMFAEHRYFTYKPEYYTVFSYDQLVSYELIEDGEGIASGGLGRAAVGGLLAGPTGAVVGGMTGSRKATCSILQVKITVKGYKEPAYFIKLIVKPIKKSESVYVDSLQMAHKIISKLQLIIDERNTERTSSDGRRTDTVDEIRKFKSLLDDGIITQKEFDTKKKQLLNI